MWPFKDKVDVYRFKRLDWDKVKTTKDLIAVLRGVNLLRDIQVSESYWEDPDFKRFCSTTIVEKTYINGRFDNVKEYDELSRNKHK